MRNKPRILTILVLCSLYTTFVSAQKFNSFFGVRFGGALPMGEFASHEYGYGGYALLGRNIGAEAAWFVTPQIGIGIDISSSSFEFASGYYAEDFYEANPGDYISISLLSSPYKLSTYMGGAYYKISIGENFYSTFKLMGGLFKAQSPDQFYGVKTYIAGNLNWWKTGALDKKFAFLTGAAFGYKLYKQVSLLLQADFTYAHAAFTFDTSSTSSYTDYLNMPVLMVQTGININF